MPSAFRPLAGDTAFPPRAPDAPIGGPSAPCFHCGQVLGEGTQALRATVAGQARAFCCAGCLGMARTLDAAGFAHLYQGETRFGRPLDPCRRAELVSVWAAYDTEELRGRFVRRIDAADGARREITLVPENLRCAACAWLIEQTLSALPGVELVVANVATRRVLVRWRGSAQTVAGLLGVLADIGYTAWPFEASASEQQERAARRGLLMRMAVAMLAMMQVMMYAWPVYTHESSIDPAHLRLMQWASLALTVPVMLYSAAPMFAAAWRGLRQRHVGMDLPVALGLGTAFGASLVATLRGTGEVYYDSVTMFVALLLLARYLELRVRQASRSAAEMLARQLPATCERLGPDGVAERVPVVRLRAGDRVRVRAGEVVPADGDIVNGCSDFDEALLTGESRPLMRRQSEPVLAGSGNVSSPVEIAVRRVGATTRLAEIVAVLERALADKPRLAVLADRVATWFVSALLVLALVTAFVWWLVEPSRALMVAVAVLVVSCPCALSLATPAALAAAGAALSRRGLLLTRGHTLETLARITDVVIDKTGTLTEGRFIVVNVVRLGRLDEADCLTLAAALEAGASHPIARALVQAAEHAPARSAAAAARATTIRNVPGDGVEAMVDGKRMRLGRRDFVLALRAGGSADSAHADASRALPDPLHDGATPVWLGSEDGVLAAFVLCDTERAQSGALLTALRKTGLRCHLVSGDSVPTVRWWASHFNIAHAEGRVSPEGKREYVAHLQRQGRVVLAIGDGINDAPVLAQAQVSIALGSGAPLAQVGADAVLMHDGIADIAVALAMARRTRRVIRQNLAWACAYNAIAIPLAASGHLSAWMAGVGMSLSSLLVVANAWRLSRLPRRV